MKKANHFIAAYAILIAACAVPLAAQTPRSLTRMEIKALSPNLMVKDVEQTVRFYQDLLGFKLVASVPAQKREKSLQWALVQSGPVTLMFQEEENLKEEYPDLKRQAIGGGFTLYLTTSGIEALYQKARQVTSIVKEPHKTFYSATEFAIKDNNGYVLTIAEQAP
jgi:uncharacterized glyoxalase superfamily protein PhnB